MRTLILTEFRKLNCIINWRAIETYVDFCIKNNIKTHSPGNSSAHHILPAAKTLPFSKFKNLKVFEWNHSELSYHNHYIAHYLLTLAINHISVYSAFCAMHSKDIKLGRLKEEDLINAEEYNLIYKKRNIKLSEYWNEEINKDGKLITRGKLRGERNALNLSPKNRKLSSIRISGKNNLVNRPGVYEKMRMTKIARNMDEIGAQNAAQTMMQEIFVDGEITTIYKITSRKISKTVTKEFIGTDGKLTSIAKQRNKEIHRKLREKGNWYILKNVFNSQMNISIAASHLRSISAGLETKTLDNYLGKSLFGKNKFIRDNKEHLIGLYVEKLSSIPQPDILSRDHILIQQIFGLILD